MPAPAGGVRYFRRDVEPIIEKSAYLNYSYTRIQSTQECSYMNRREFLKSGGIVGTVLIAGPAAMRAEGKPQRFKIGMAATLWMSEHPNTGGYWKACEAIRSLNIGATEVDNSLAKLDTAYGTKVAEFEHESAREGVALQGVYHAIPLHERSKFQEMRQNTARLAKFLKSVGAPYIALGWDVPAGPGGQLYQRTPADVKTAITAIDEIGKMCQEEYGMLIALHLECDIKKEIMLEILDRTNPRYAHFCPDVGHLTAAGLDAVSTVKKYASRVAVSHWKDFDPHAAAPEYLGSEARGNFVELGKGIVDFPGLAELFKGIDFSGWVMIELDGTRMPLLESARMMKAYVTDRLGLRVYGQHA